MTLETITNWVYETPDTHTKPVPIMPREEREAWHRLSNKRLQSQAGGPRLTLAEGKLLFALDRKIKARAAHEDAA